MIPAQQSLCSMEGKSVSDAEAQRLTDLINNLWKALPADGLAQPVSPDIVRQRLDAYMESEMEKWIARGGSLDEFDATPNAVKEAIDERCLAGSAAQNEEDYETALRKYRECLELLPKPFYRYVTTVFFVLVGLADILFCNNARLEIARSCMQLSFLVKGDVSEDGFAHYLYGKICLKLGDVERATYELNIAWEQDKTLFDPDSDDDSFEEQCRNIVNKKTTKKKFFGLFGRK